MPHKYTFMYNRTQLHQTCSYLLVELTHCSITRYFTPFVSASFQLFSENLAPNPHNAPSLTTSTSKPPADLSCGHLRMQTLHTPALLPCIRLPGAPAFSLRGQLPGAREHARPASAAKPHQKNCARGARAGKQAGRLQQAGSRHGTSTTWGQRETAAFLHAAELGGSLALP